MRRKIILVICWLAVLILAGVIFSFSAQGGPASQKASDQVVNYLLPIFRPDYPQLPGAQQQEILHHWRYIVRKSAHFLEFTLLGLALRLALSNYRRLKYAPPIAWLLGTAYAASDEWHQAIVGTRTGMWQDVALDSAGVLTGVLIACVLLHLRKKWKAKRGRTD